MNSVFANRSEEDVIYPLTVKEIAEAQEADPNIRKLTNDPQYTRQLMETHNYCAKELSWSFLLPFDIDQ